VFAAQKRVYTLRQASLVALYVSHTCIAVCTKPQCRTVLFKLWVCVDHHLWIAARLLGPAACRCHGSLC
jgi:hypothetical protein